MGTRLLAVACVVLGLLIAPPRASADPPASEELAALDARLLRAPDDLSARLSRARLRGDRGDLDGALDDARAALALSPRGEDAALVLSELLAMRGERESALAELDAIVGERVAGPRTHGLRARLLAELGRYEESLRAWDEVLVTRESAEAWMSRGRVLEELGRDHDALTSYETGAQSVAGAVSLRSAAIELALRLHEPERALTQIDVVLSSAPGRARWLALRAEALAMLGRTREARASFEAALSDADRRMRTRPSAATLVDRGRALLGLGRVDEARESVRRARSYAPDYEPARELQRAIERSAR